MDNGGFLSPSNVMNTYISNTIETYKKENEKLQQENKQLKERVTYLENSNNRREETIMNLRHEQQLDKYKEVIEEVREYIDNIVPCIHDEELLDELLQILDKVKEQ